MSADPWSGNSLQPGTLHKHSYVANRPTTFVDSSGLQPDGSNPWDPQWCNDWGWQKWICKRIVNNPDSSIAHSAMHDVYADIVAGMHLRFDRAPIFWRRWLFTNDLFGGGGDLPPLRLQGDEWGAWMMTKPLNKEMHNRQVDDFFLFAVLPAAINCQTRVGPIHIGRAPGGLAGQNQYPNYRFVEAGSAAHDVTVALGRNYLEGYFTATNIRMTGSRTVSADLLLERFVSDRFDFEGDTGNIPLPRIAGDLAKVVGYGTVPNVWAHTLEDEGYANPFDIYIEWEERYSNFIWHAPLWL